MIYKYLASFFIGASRVLDLSPPIPSYEEEFGTDEQLLADDRRKVQEDIEAESTSAT